jgi:DNA-binding NtrC family response regulator
MIVLNPGDILRSTNLPADFGKASTTAIGDDLHLRPGMTVGEAERRLIFETLAFTSNNKTRAAEMLGISLKTLHNKLKEYEAEPQS